MWRFLFVLSCVVVSLFGSGHAKLTVEEKIREDPDLSEFYALLERNRIANTTLMYRQVTLFAPTNQAFQRHKLPIDDSWVLYHMTNLAQTLEQMPNTLSSELEGNPPLWITKYKSTHYDEIYINNAKILPHKSNYISMNAQKRKQILHVIDDVLVPVSASPTSTDPVYNPDAFQFLTRSEDFDIGPHRVRSFRQKVTQIKKSDIFKHDGRYTFFIPVDEGFKPQPRPELIDAKVVDGHVIPNLILFTRPTTDDTPFETMAFGDNLKVTISFTKTQNGQEQLTYIKSNTIVGDSKHATGVVLADIVKANIPVKNGVVHLIQRPLMVVDTSVTQFLEVSPITPPCRVSTNKEVFVILDFTTAAKVILNHSYTPPEHDKEDGPLFKFYENIMDAGGEFLQTLNRMRDLTLFAPSNEAWEDSNLKNLIRNKERLLDILNLHLVREKLPLDKIVHNNLHQIFQVPTVADRKSLYFNVVHHGNNQTLTVEGGGVNATVIQPNIATTNGIVHIINRVLGVPYTTVLEKLMTDPMLNDTYFLGRRRSFNSQLNNTNQRFTYFVPRDKAWRDFETQYPSAHKKMFMEDFSYHTQQILERHLVIADRAYTMADIKMLSNDTHGFVLPTIRDILRLRIKESDKTYEVEWQNQWIHVFRPDVECTNGIIHVIDYPFLTESDIHVTGGATANLAISLLPNIIMVFIVKWLIH